MGLKEIGSLFLSAVNIPFTDGLSALLQGMVNEAWKNCRFEALFVENGKFLAGIDGQNEALCEDLKRAFSAENMQKLFRQSREADDYEWQRAVSEGVRSLLAGYEIDGEVADSCANHFVAMFKNYVRGHVPQLYDRMYQAESRAKTCEALAANGQVQALILDGVNQLNRNFDELIAALPAQLPPAQTPSALLINHAARSWAQEQSGTEPAEKFEWNLACIEIKGVFGPKEKRGEEIRSLTALWQRERAEYPGWYILPVEKRTELAAVTRGAELLAEGEQVTPEEMLDFAYELAWRFETGMLEYTAYLLQQIRAVWDRLEPGEGDSSWEDGTRGSQWFYLGQCLLREYREIGRRDAWQEVYGRLEARRALAQNPELAGQDLRLERIKRLYMDMELQEARQELQSWEIPPMYFSHRLQAIGLLVEFGCLREALLRLCGLEQDIDGDLAKEARTREGNRRELYDNCLLACIHHLKGLCMQNLSYIIAWGDTEPDENKITQEQICGEYAAAEHLSPYFSFREVREELAMGLYRLRERSAREAEPFEINREQVTLIGSGSECSMAYGAYRVMDKAALPLQVHCVTLMGELEPLWLGYLFERRPHTGRFLLLRGSNSSNVKEILTRTVLALTPPEQMEEHIRYTMDALRKNIGGMACGGEVEDIYRQIAKNAANALGHMAAKSADYQQKELVVLLGQLLERGCIRNVMERNQLIERVLGSLSDRVKASMLSVMLEYPILEQQRVGDRVLDVEPFDCLGFKELAKPMYRIGRPEPARIDRLFSLAGRSAHARRCVVSRLIALCRLNLLSPQELQRFGELLWSSRRESTGLPDTTGYDPDVFLELPHPPQVSPQELVKEYFLRTDWREEVGEEDGGVRMTWGNIPYLNQLISLHRYVEGPFWEPGEAEILFTRMAQVWEEAKEESASGKRRLYPEAGEYRRRCEKMIHALASFAGHVRGGLRAGSRQLLKQLGEEMGQSGYHTLVFDMLAAGPGREWDEAAFEPVVDGLYDENLHTVIDAAETAFDLILGGSKEAEQAILPELLGIVRSRKQPALSSALNVLHNLLYAGVELPEQAWRRLCRAMAELLSATDYEKNCGSEAQIKRCISARSCGANLAFQMHLYCKRRGLEVPREILGWKELCAGPEFAEVRRQWIGEL